MHSKEDILAVIRTHLSNAVDDVPAETIEPERSMKDYGANSLDIVEVVSASMRQLRIKVPRAKLKELKDIQGLVDLLYVTGQEQKAS
jgi:acyl carrier protein